MGTKHIAYTYEMFLGPIIIWEHVSQNGNVFRLHFGMYMHILGHLLTVPIMNFCFFSQQNLPWVPFTKCEEALGLSLRMFSVNTHTHIIFYISCFPWCIHLGGHVPMAYFIFHFVDLSSHWSCPREFFLAFWCRLSPTFNRLFNSGGQCLLRFLHCTENFWHFWSLKSPLEHLHWF